MTAARYHRTRKTKEAAVALWRQLIQTRADRTVYCLLDGPDDDYVVCDLRTAIETGLPYQFA